MQTLRDYQTEAIHELRLLLRDGKRRLLLQAATGSGKTTIAAAMIDGAVKLGRRVVFLAHRKELIDQCSARLDGLGIDHGIVMADHPRRRPHLPVQVASIQTLVKRQLYAPPTLIFIDEAHRAAAKTYKSLLDRWPADAAVIGLTATPIRSDGKGLASLFEAMVQCPSLQALTDLGYLVPAIHFSTPTPDLKAVHVTAGDYDLQELACAMNTRQLVGNLVREWSKRAAGRRTVAFAVDIEHSKAIVADFRASDVPAEHLDGTTPRREREAILARLASGSTLVVSNVGVLTEGWDCPSASCVILARPTMSLGLYLQMSGRVLRPADDKTDCLILDHAGCVREHGLVSLDREWELTADRLFKKGKKPDISDTFKVCPDCDAELPKQTRKCPNCGYSFSDDAPIKYKEGELVPVTEAASLVPEARRRGKYERWLWQAAYTLTAAGRSYSPKYPDVRYHSEFNAWPSRKWRDEWLRVQSAKNPDFVPNWKDYVKPEKKETAVA